MAQATLGGVRRRWLVYAMSAVFVLLLVLSGLSGFYVDVLWFREVRFSSVFWTIFQAKAILGLASGALFFVLLLANLVIARRLTPRFRVPSPEQEVIERYRQAVEPYVRVAVPAFAAFVAVLVGLAAAARWSSFLLWRSAGSAAFGPDRLDPLFGRDPSFYIFVLPFQKFVQGWLFSALVGVLVISAVAHYLLGNIRTQGVGERVLPAVRAHLSVLLGLIMVVKAWGYRLGQFDLLLSARGTVTGASYTDVRAHLPALKLLMWIALVVAVLFLVNIRLRGWALPALGIVLLALVSTVAGALIPAAVQRFQVAPQELQREAPFIERDIEATRFAWGIDVDTGEVDPAGEVTSEQVQANPTTIENIRLWNPGILAETYRALQRIQPYYEFPDVDVDRYPINGRDRMVMLSPRELSHAGIPGSPGWQTQHLIYTHGFGAVASRVSTSTRAGAPEFLLRDIPTPPDAPIPLDPGKGSQIYFGEVSDVPYVFVGTQQRELNYPDPTGPGSISTDYRGKGGISVGSFFRRLVFAYRYRDFNVLISGLIDDDSRILINRDIRTRVQKIAPFLLYDQDPYAAIVGRHLHFVWDAYTVTDLYPYSQRADLAEATNNDLQGRANYMRNSVKVVVNAYDGTVRFYVVEPEDPLIQVWQRAFPRLFTDVSEAPPELVEHFRYPEDLLQAQGALYTRYHVTDAATFYNNAERWQVPDALPLTTGGDAEGTLRPYYVLFKMPGETDEEFVLFQPFTPTGRANMVGYMVGGSDPERYGELTAFEFPPGEIIEGPQQVRNLLNQDPTVSQQITLLSQEGSEVLFGDLIIVPIEDAFLYVQPLFVSAANVANAIPELKRVVVVHGGNATIGNTLEEALAASFGEEEPGPPPVDGEPGPVVTVNQLLEEAVGHFTSAEALLTQGDLAGYQREIEAAEEAIRRARELAAGGGTVPPSPSPGASPPPSPTPSPSPT